MTEMIWVNNENDCFPGEYFCYILVSHENGVTMIHDVQRSRKPLSKEALDALSKL